MPATHVIGLLLGAEEDWPVAFESLLERVAPSITVGGTTHRFTTERVTIEPFNLRAVPRYSLIIDRLAWWYHLPREWLKKVALMDDVHLLNNPFTFQSMEKHAAYCAMMRLGLRVPGLSGGLEPLAAMGRPVLQSSANPSGGAAARRLEDVDEGIRAGVDLVLDGGELPGTPSTVVDLSAYEEGGSWSVAREGAVPTAELEEALA